jgi:hypothetical protein
MKKKIETFMIVADYEEYYPETYKGVVLYNKGKELFRSYTGNFKRDYDIVVKYARKNVKGVIYNSSTIDNWFMDSK